MVIVTRGEWITVKETAAWFGTSPHTIYRAVATGKIRAIKFGIGEKKPRYRISVTWLKQWIESQEAALTP